MDEAERCHRLAFIFSGRLLDTGTPEEIVQRRALNIVELEADRATEAADLLRALPDVDEVAHYGHLLRVATRGDADPERLVADALAAHGINAARLRRTRTTVEDAFVSMVRHENDGPGAGRA
jgi:ABC-2 type transport system ATP-binding protein